MKKLLTFWGCSPIIIIEDKERDKALSDLRFLKKVKYFFESLLTVWGLRVYNDNEDKERGERHGKQVEASTTRKRVDTSTS